MADNILVAVAWPYANGSIHLGQAAGCYLPADIFARYHRLKGNNVLMVSGSDSHGTPITLQAEKTGKSPDDIVDSYHNEFLNNWRKFGISFDLFTTTRTENHSNVVEKIFNKLLEKGHIYKSSMSQPFCPKDNRFLPDRYVEGVCPNCDFEAARGDQCDNCGRTLDPQDLKEIKCRICSDTPEFRNSEHFFLKLTDFEDSLADWIQTQSHWKTNVKNFSKAYIQKGLKDRAITRDINWGVPVPVQGYENKRIYVWFEAVIGYLSASIEWSESQVDVKWEDFWTGDSKAYYFMGKDNIPFHTIIWPAILTGYEGLNLPYDVPANEYLQLEGLKFSTSRDWAVWLPEYLDKYDPDPLRYVLTAIMPETSDSDFTWEQYKRLNNDELVATFGNLVHRTLSMLGRNFDSQIPEKPAKLDDESIQLLEFASKELENIALNIELCKFKLALESAMKIARNANQYLDAKKPWHTIKTSVDETKKTLWVSLAILNCLKIGLYPFLPFTAEKLHGMLGYGDEINSSGWNWQPDDLISGSILPKPQPLFKKIDIDEDN
ncbi:MAG: methionine--tRNA ligase [SAR202 cluster bacterium]|nr:methionine--tRNA ligase [Chloroflexota bacterium]MQG38669.1 methionine--tRNA ligase [SAR202 cluster bacterium]|tara:strand:- start:2639 stop:4282 length:1644 start_codon:yes stop_codon:yes gene_type:complete